MASQTPSLCSGSLFACIPPPSPMMIYQYSAGPSLGSHLTHGTPPPPPSSIYLLFTPCFSPPLLEFISELHGRTLHSVLCSGDREASCSLDSQYPFTSFFRLAVDNVLNVYFLRTLVIPLQTYSDPSDQLKLRM